MSIKILSARRPSIIRVRIRLTWAEFHHLQTTTKLKATNYWWKWSTTPIKSTSNTFIRSCNSQQNLRNRWNNLLFRTSLSVSAESMKKNKQLESLKTKDTSKTDTPQLTSSTLSWEQSSFFSEKNKAPSKKALESSTQMEWNTNWPPTTQ